MKHVIVQHESGEFYALIRNESGETMAVYGPLTLMEAQQWLRRPEMFRSAPENVAWARSQVWQPMAADVLRSLQTIAQKKNRRDTTLANMLVWGVITVIVVGAIAFWQYAKSQDPRYNGTATSTPAARGIPINQLTGTDWLTLSFSDRQGVINTTIGQRIHCPSTVTSNDLAIAVTQAANTTAGRSQKVIDLLAVLFSLDGCVIG